MSTEVEREAEAPIHGDILESILAHVSLINLVPFLHVSKSWNLAVYSSLNHLNPIKPWLIVYTYNTRSPHVITTRAYDPRSRAWVEIHKPPSAVRPASVRSSNSSLLYTLSSAAFTFSVDPIHLTWHHAHAPRVSRTDPIVALVGRHIVVAGGACDFEDDPLAVEVFDLKTNTWSACRSMPEILKGSATSTWLSVAVAGEKMHVTEKISGVTYSFNPVKNTWDGPYNLRPDDRRVYSTVTGATRRRMIVVGLIGEPEDMKGVKLWEVRGGFGPELGSGLSELCEVPEEMVAKLKGEGGWVSSVSMAAAGESVFLYNSAMPEWVILGEEVAGVWEWESVQNDGMRLQRMVVGVGEVRIEDLQKGVRENWRFSLKERKSLDF